MSVNKSGTKGLSVKIIIGLLAGVLTGLFFGEDVAFFSYVGDAFIALLQMTVLPYIILTLIVNIGRLDLNEGKKLISKGAVVLLGLMMIGFLTIIIFTFSFPEWSSGNFFSISFTQKPPSIDFIKLYFPANPFESMANNTVPAVVLFSIFVGIAMAKITGTGQLLRNMEVLANGLNQVNKMVIKLTPYGVFGIAASTAGTITIEELEKMQAFLIVYTVIVLILVFWLLPYLISLFTPIRYKELFRETRTTLLTIFATGKIIVVLPMLMDDLKRLLDKHKDLNEDSSSEVNILMPLAYPFPNIGTLAILVFVPFAAWFIGKPLTFGDYPMFVGAGTLSGFINPITGIPFLLGLFDIPDNLVGMYLMTTVYTDRIRVVLGAMHLVALTIIVIYLSAKKRKISKKKLTSGLLITLALYVVAVVGIRAFLSVSVKNIKTKKELVMELGPSLQTVPVEIIRKPVKNPVKLKYRQTRLSRIRSRDKLRAGCISNNPPYSYFNKKGELVGMDIDLAHQLAASLDVDLELVIVNNPYENAGKDYFDVFISGIPLTGTTAEKFHLSDPYTDLTMALIAEKNNSEFDSFKTLSKKDTFTIAYVYRLELVRKFNHYFPQAGYLQINSKDLFFSLPDSLRPDALLSSAESGAILTMFYPDYKIVNPLPYTIKIPKVFMIDGEDKEFERYLNNYIKVMKSDGNLDYLYQHWVLGLDVEKKGKRWSIIRNVLHWQK